MQTQYLDFPKGFKQASWSKVAVFKKILLLLYILSGETIAVQYDHMTGGNMVMAKDTTKNPDNMIQHNDGRLNSLYGKNPMAIEAFIRLFPSRMRM